MGAPVLRIAPSPVGTALRGAVAGVLAGGVFAGGQMGAALASGLPATMPWRIFGSVVLGRAAFEAPLALALAAGVAVHLLVSAGWGALLASTYERSALRRLGPAFSAAVGGLYGLVVWIVNFAVLALLFFPWLLDLGVSAQVMLHIFFFGVPLGFIEALLARRALAQPARPA